MFTVSLLDSEEAVLETLCTAPAETIAFVSAEAYVLAAEQCQAEVGSVLVNNDGISWQTGMIVSRRDSGINALADLEGRSWAVSDPDDLATYLYFQALLQDEGIEPGEIVEVSGESAAMLAVFEGEVDFASAEYIPPIMPYEERLWEYGEDDPEPDRYLGIPPQRSPIGYVVVNGDPEFGGYRLRDARARVFDVAPEIYNETQIVTLSEQIPNDTVTFGRDFPLGLARQVIGALEDFAASAACDESLCATDFYNLTGLQPAQQETYAPVAFVQDTLGLSSDEMLNLASR
jgi:phosphonate transport system substrate-binding protein